MLLFSQKAIFTYDSEFSPIDIKCRQNNDYLFVSMIEGHLFVFDIRDPFN